MLLKELAGEFFVKQVRNGESIPSRDFFVFGNGAFRLGLGFGFALFGFYLGFDLFFGLLPGEPNSVA